MKPEAAFAARVREGLKASGADIERIENRINLGIADCLVGVGSRHDCQTGPNLFVPWARCDCPRRTGASAACLA